MWRSSTPPEAWAKNGTDYNMRYCWIIHVLDDRVVKVVGYYYTQTVAALFA